MLRIPCPWCGDRDEIEFAFGGEAHVHHPADPEALSDEDWARYVFVRANPGGMWTERWCHTAGCRRWFDLGRDTTTQAIVTVRGKA
jgi:sarcosine oxidase subunit alpha/sarcosine oxidase subunit delta